MIFILMLVCVIWLHFKCVSYAKDLCAVGGYMYDNTPKTV